MDKVSIFGVNINNVTFDATIKLIKEYLKEDTLKVIFTPNTEIVVAAKEDEGLKDLINKGDLVVPDGIGLIYGSRIGKKPLKERVTGFDISMELLNIAEENKYGLFLLGGKPGVSDCAVEKIKNKYPNIRIAGHHHGFFNWDEKNLEASNQEENILNEINNSSSDIIFVGLGFPKQEMWIDKNRNKLKGKIIIGNGGVIDVLAGNAKRAPDIFIKLGLEWLYRLITDPKRIKRQIALPKFMFQVILNKNAIK